jgi:hypothetical protein
MGSIPNANDLLITKNRNDFFIFHVDVRNIFALQNKWISSRKFTHSSHTCTNKGLGVLIFLPIIVFVVLHFGIRGLG